MFKVIDLTAEGKPEESEDLARVAPPRPGVVRWVDLIETDKGALELLRQRFEFHPLALEDCGTFELRSKFDEYGEYLFIVLHAFTAAPDDPIFIQIHEVHAFLSEHYLVTVHDNPLKATEVAWRRAASDPTVLQRGPAWAFYTVVDAMVDATFPVIENLVARVERVEEKVLTGSEPVDLSEIFSVRSTLVTMRRVLRPVRDTIAVLTRRADPPLSERTAMYFRDVHDHVMRCLESIEEAESLISNTIEANKAAIGTRSNEIMAKLTIFSAIFLPLGFIVGFWGQNFDSLPFHNEHLLWWLTVVPCAAVPVVLMIWFWWKDWV
ncbi:MAG TPA: magnesium transporter CorA family protein [Kofleriaceae bacterium]|nr:magnesium transporter CorA family protein [Kofleriaceae bacterium]